MTNNDRESETLPSFRVVCTVKYPTSYILDRRIFSTWVVQSSKGTVPTWIIKALMSQSSGPSIVVATGLG
ncbi:uncharacterized protein YALI1_F21676g [Yarrowia lipolytica]|uniref:Uncharacterized protein n=1 Tax=Yarrowia lipolytica TaxID=4952 RepID=A0A1D8NNP9_YARLL|nr:hypothetical protein YALI1_F21676g [Yarrowia lipolytica]